MTNDMVMIGIAFFFAAAGPIGVGVLVGVAGRDVLDLSGTNAGLILFGGSMSALLLGPTWGRVLDRMGQRPAAIAAATSATVLTGLLVFADRSWLLAVIWLFSAGVVAFFVVVFQALGATIMPDNRGGALSFLLAFRFLGHAVGPIVLIPLIDDSASLAFLASAALGLVALVIVITRVGRAAHG